MTEIGAAGFSSLKPGAAAHESSLDSVLYAAKNSEVCPHVL